MDGRASSGGVRAGRCGIDAGARAAGRSRGGGALHNSWRHSAREPAPDARERATRANPRQHAPRRALYVTTAAPVFCGRTSATWAEKVGANADVSCAKLESGSAARGCSGHHPARPLELDSLHIALYTVGHEKSCPIAGCPYQRKRGNFHLFSSRGHTALADDRRAVRP